MKKRLLSYFLLGFTVLLLILLIQTSFGKYKDEPIVPWAWLLALYLPLLFLVLQIKTKFRIEVLGLKWLSILFVLASFLVIFLQPLALKYSDISFANTLKFSALFFFPLEIFLCYLILKKIIKKQVEETSEEYIPQEPIVFISYNHEDQNVAQKIYDALKKAKIEVLMDTKKMKAGEDIKNFIDSCVKDSNITLSLVSNKSLRSAWVAMETTNTFFLEKFSPHKKFIACYLDEDFFKSDFTLNAVADIDKKIKENQELIPKYHEKMLDTRDLNNQNTRLLELRNNLDEIVRRLRESLCLDMRQEKFEQSLQQLILTLKVAK